MLSIIVILNEIFYNAFLNGEYEVYTLLYISESKLISM